MFVTAPVWGPVFIVVGVRDLLRLVPGTGRPIDGGSAPRQGHVVGFGLFVTVGLSAIFTAMLVSWLAFDLPPEGPARVPVALVAASLVSSLLFFPVVVISASLDMGVVERRARRASE
ncbi:hypothetical protein SAMN05216223_107242 [Actinacidiphila yanglinensis]|uniref:Uncharacterized protein n=2 Tax=Actinacidiphila yanglinensis TaxID=310779 RepID=A0A1H6BUX6_9ACTN|nr:hypothetical protein SAMN05216223_107242 [Actinacidiphila yanglinensis]